MGQSAESSQEASSTTQEGRVKNGITFDTGALIALERRGQRARMVLERALETSVRITVPTPVITEWWRGRTDARQSILRAIRVEPLSEAIAQLAGLALASVQSATPIDAIVMASAAQRGDVVYTSDVEDLQDLAAYFPSVRVLGIG
jgi:predicted nucleic acid-binding protein